MYRARDARADRRARVGTSQDDHPAPHKAERARQRARGRDRERGRRQARTEGVVFIGLVVEQIGKAAEVGDHSKYDDRPDRQLVVKLR